MYSRFSPVRTVLPVSITVGRKIQDSDPGEAAVVLMCVCTSTLTPSIRFVTTRYAPVTLEDDHALTGKRQHDLQSRLATDLLLSKLGRGPRAPVTLPS